MPWNCAVFLAACNIDYQRMPWNCAVFLAACNIDYQRMPWNFSVFMAAFKRYYNRQSFFPYFWSSQIPKAPMEDSLKSFKETIYDRMSRNFIL